VYSVEVTIPNPENRLKAGMIASLALEGQQLPRSEAAVPLEAVVRSPDNPKNFAVLIAVPRGDTVTVHARNVVLGNPIGNDVVVLGGVKPGELVVTTGASMVRDGEQVRVIP
jgi:multidrug efflux pump subunit AcrA (membrane-fusion protein)